MVSKKMTQYDAFAFDPPAPVTQVALRNSATGAVISKVSMQLDTGADATLVPRDVVELLGIEVDESYGEELRGFDNKADFFPKVYLEIVFLRRRFRGYFLIIPSVNGILGRDILNGFTLIFDGKSLSWSEIVSEDTKTM